ncbi:hypothetical protein CSKR_110061 [Clonorchis sinensis]|uniref:R3H-associated N-terminal domain-containing protein n=1 Tax=Clonorchis sinensis TaxID=79923 RepID=A0A8T1M630_CLOSI|nr:hypothetical protein CSKR_110061 [Clonorchis sinensis]
MTNRSSQCQSLSHYSEFETGSESGLSELSLVHPYQPKKFGKRSKSVADPSHRVVHRGARATRRYENEAFLNTLSAIAETDGEDLAMVAWPDSISHCSAFAKLFEDDSIRAVWDVFVSLSETEQERLLRSLRRSNTGSDTSDSDPDESVSDCGHSPIVSRDAFDHLARRRPQSNTRRRRSKRGHHRKSKSQLPHCPSPSGEHDLELPDTVASFQESAGHSKSAEAQAELRGFLPPRFLALISRSHMSGGRRGRRVKRLVTPLDFCLIDRVETELRRWFTITPPDGDNIASWIDQKRWTPTVSLLGEVDLRRWMLENESFPDLLQLDAFERLVVHSVASYLGLGSYSNWSETLRDRQLWVEKRFGHTFTPPNRTLVNLLKAHFSQP